MRFKVQCISNNSGFYQRLEIGRWYEAELYTSRSTGRSDQYIIYDLGNKEHPLDIESGVFDMSLFVTVEQKRDNTLNKLGI